MAASAVSGKSVPPLKVRRCFVSAKPARPDQVNFARGEFKESRLQEALIVVLQALRDIAIG